MLQRDVESTVSNVSSARLKIVVVGAGLSGLAAAIQSALGGHSVLVLENAKELGEVGAGLRVSPNASNLLQRWGLPEKFWVNVAKPKSLKIRRYADGKIIYDEQNFGKDMQQRYGALFANIHRADLQRAMYERARELGVDFGFGQKIVDVDVANGRVTSITNQTFQGDLIIGADGLWSKCREALLGKQDPPTATGDLVYRIILNADDVPDKDLQDRIMNPEINFWLGPDSHVVSYSVRAGAMLNIVLMCTDDLPPEVSKKEGSCDELREIFSGWDPTLTRYLNLVTQVDKWKLMHRPEIKTWINEEGNFALIGDSCHPMIPYLAQGANSSIEDGAIIGLLLGKMTSRNQLPRAVKLYQELRKSRGEKIARESLAQREVYQLRDGPEQEERDAIFERASENKEKKQGRFPFRWVCPVIEPWLFGYDAEEEVEKALQMNPFH